MSGPMKRCVQCNRQYDAGGEYCPFDGGVLVEVAADPLVGRVLDGKYRIDSRISAGGMGTVYRATHILMDHVCAIKVLHDSMMTDPSAIPRFQREAKAAARIRHQNAIAVTDFGITSDRSSTSSWSLRRAQPARGARARPGRSASSDTAYIIEQVAPRARHGARARHRSPRHQARQHHGAHVAGRPVEEVKVLDFGIAKLKDMAGRTEKLTDAGMVIGTPNYLSPEQCRAMELDARSDIYSLGIVVYELLSGKVPFAADDAPRRRHDAHGRSAALAGRPGSRAAAEGRGGGFSGAR